MAKIGGNLEDAKDFEPVPDNTYAAHTIRSQYLMSKQSNQPKLEFDWEIDEGEFAGRKVNYDNLSLSPAATNFLLEFLDALKYPRTCEGCGDTHTKSMRQPKIGAVCPNCKQKTRFNFEAGDPLGQAFLGARCKIIVGSEPNPKNPDKINNKVNGYAALA